MLGRVKRGGVPQTKQGAEALQGKEGKNSKQQTRGVRESSNKGHGRNGCANICWLRKRGKGKGVLEIELVWEKKKTG